MMRISPTCPSWAWLVPPIFLALTIAFLCVDVLHWDEWVIWSELLGKMRDGIFGVADLASQQNEQRNMAARVFGLLLMPLFKLNRFAEYALNFLLAAGTFTSIFFLYKRTTGIKPSPCLSLAFSMLSFSTVQWEAFTFGANSSVLVVPLGIWLGALLATGGKPSLPRLLALGAIGILPSFSFANGLFYWLCLAPLILNQGRKHNILAQTSTLWGLMTITAWALYFWNFQSPGHHQSLLDGFTQPLQLAGYFFGYLGGAISSDKKLAPLAVAIGVLSAGILLWLTVNIWKAKNVREKALPWLAAAAFTLLSATVTALARCDFGIGQALESRYATFSTPYWISLAALFYLSESNKDATFRTNSFARHFGLTCAGVLLLSTVLSTIVVYNRHDRFTVARKALYSLTDEKALHAIFPDTAYLMMKLPLFLENRLSIYRNIKPLDEYTIGENAIGSFDVKHTPPAADNRIHGFRASGSVQPENARDAQVLLASKGRLVGVLPLEMGATTWELFIPDNYLPNGEKRIQAYLTHSGSALLTPIMPSEGIELDRFPQEKPSYTLHNHFFIN